MESGLHAALAERQPDAVHLLYVMARESCRLPHQAEFFVRPSLKSGFALTVIE
jgi:hypothetical protein